ncbi:MAG: hypothetical protein IKO00_13160 [Oscillospiraceae bacterium]|nr:hypothetical protein [Oscillospiraceae bacterium]
MNFAWVKPMLRSAKQFSIKNISHILMGMATAESLAGVIMIAQASPKALDEWLTKKLNNVMDKHRNLDYYEAMAMVQRGDFPDCNPTFWETVKIYGKHMGFAAAMELVAIVSFWAAHGIDIHRQMVWAGLATTAEESLREYQAKMKEMLGKEGDKAVKDAIAQDKIDKLPPPQNTVILDGDADYQFIFDDQYFRSSYLKIKEAENDANHDMIQNMYISMSELKWMLDPERKYLKLRDGDGMKGWSVDKMIVLDIDWGEDANHKPIGVVKVRDKDGMDYSPSAGFSRMY